MTECPTCHEEKEDEAFRPGHRPCRACLSRQSRDAWLRRAGADGVAEYQREYQRTNRTALSAKSWTRIARWRAAHPDETRAQRQRRIARGTSATAKQRRRAHMVAAPVNDFTATQWREMKRDADGRCHYCHEVRPLTMDHIVPISKGGSHTASNIVPACQPCNSRKRDRLLSAA